MSLKKKKHEIGGFGIKQILRIIIFASIISLFIGYFTSAPKIQFDFSRVLGVDTQGTIENIGKSIPKNYQDVFKNLPNTSQYNQISQITSTIQKQASISFNDHIKNIKLGIVTNIYQDIVKNIERK